MAVHCQLVRLARPAPANGMRRAAQQALSGGLPAAARRPVRCACAAAVAAPRRPAPGQRGVVQQQVVERLHDRLQAQRTPISMSASHRKARVLGLHRQWVFYSSRWGLAHRAHAQAVRAGFMARPAHLAVDGPRVRAAAHDGALHVAGNAVGDLARAA